MSLPIDQILLLFGVSVIFSVAIFGLLATFISMQNYQYSPLRDRLLLLKQQHKKDQGETIFTENSGELFDNLRTALLTVSEPISKNLYGQNKKYMTQIKVLLTEAGLPEQDSHITQFLTYRAATGLILGVLLFIAALIVSHGMLFAGLSFLIGGFLVGSLLPQINLKMKANKRKEKIRSSMPDTLDLMVVCVEAGLALEATMQRVSEETEQMAPQLSVEFKRLNKELNAGISRVEAFQNLGHRSGVDELRSLCAMIIQSDKMGTSIADTLRVYADDLRVKRRQRAEEMAAKASIKMTFPLVFFIFPPLFIVLMGPIVIQAVQQFFPHK